MNEEKRVWGYSDSHDPDMWSEPYPTKEEAVAAAVAQFTDGQEIYVIDGSLCLPTQFMPDADEIREITADRAADELGCDAACDYPDVTHEALEELDAFLTAWAAKHIRQGVWLADGCPQLVRRKK